MQHTLRYFQICDSVDNYGAVLQRARSERAIAQVFSCTYFVCGHLELWVGVFGCAGGTPFERMGGAKHF